MKRFPASIVASRESVYNKSMETNTTYPNTFNAFMNEMESLGHSDAVARAAFVVIAGFAPSFDSKVTLSMRNEMLEIIIACTPASW